MVVMFAGIVAMIACGRETVSAMKATIAIMFAAMVPAVRFAPKSIATLGLRIASTAMAMAMLVFVAVAENGRRGQPIPEIGERVLSRTMRMRIDLS